MGYNMDYQEGRVRRQYGTGTILQRHRPGCEVPTGGRKTCACPWQARVEAGYTRSGGRRRVTVSGATRAEATSKLRELQRDLAAGNTATGGRLTVMAWSKQWLEEHARTVRPKTYGTDAGAVSRWIIPTIGHKRLADLTPADVRSVVRAVEAAGRSSTTARHAHWTLIGMLKAARADGHPVPALVLEVSAPEKAVSDRLALSVPELAAVLRVILDRPDRARWVASILQGMRQGEVLGLTWDRVDLTRGTIDVCRQLQALPYIDRKDKARGYRVPRGYLAEQVLGSWHLVKPKTAHGTRIIPLVPWMRAELSRLRAEDSGGPLGLVWHDGERPVDPRADRLVWAQIQAEVGVSHPSGRPYAGHETRHAAATMLLEAGVDPLVVRGLLGHSTVLVTQGYQHASQRLALEALESVAERLGLQPS